MTDIRIDIRTNIKDAIRKVGAIGETQIPFATSQALNVLAGLVQKAESANLKDKFPTATPFTLNSVSIKHARKSDPTAVVYIKPIAAKYLAPYEDGGKHFLSGRALLNPKDIPLNVYGNLPLRTLKNLKKQKNVLVGAVDTKGGRVNGIWQRIPGSKGVKSKLKLLIRFGDALPVKIKLGFGSQAASIVDHNAVAVFDQEMNAAIATALK